MPTKSKSSKSSKDINNIIFKDINDEYAWSKYGDFKVIMMKQNGYINVTKLCALSKNKNGTKKDFKEWNKNSTTKELLDEISKNINVPRDNLLIKITTGSKKLTIIRGTYAHPLLLTHIAYWISPLFAIKISLWIEEWKQYSPDNIIKYYDALSKIKLSNNNQKELEVQKEIHRKLGGKIEVNTKVGKIDLLTKKKLVEIKTYDNWKSAIGQLIAYSYFYPDRKKYLYLFNVENNDTVLIDEICVKNDIRLKIYD